MKVEIEFIKDIPIKQINEFQDRVVYDVALYTREFTKNDNAFPYLTGELMRSEVALPIMGSNKVYSLGAGVDYAKYVWKMENANWANPSTQPKWYAREFEKHHANIVGLAISNSLKEIK